MNPPIPTVPCANCGKTTNDIQFRGNAPEGCSEVWCSWCFREQGNKVKVP